MSSRIKKIIIFFSLLMAVGLILPTVALAAAAPLNMSTLGSVFGNATLGQIIIRLIQIILALLGLIAVALLFYAGFMWMTSQGDPRKVQKARQIIYGVVIGLIIIFSAFAITAFIFDRFGPPPPPLPCDPAIESCGPCDPAADPSRNCSTDGGRCAGLQTCSASSYWGSCVKLDPNCPSRQWAKIIGFKSDSLAWLGTNLSQPVGIPKTSDLQTNSSAYYRGGSFTGVQLWWGPDVLPPSFVSSSDFVGVPPAVETFSNVFAPFGVMDYATSSIIKVKMTAQPVSASAFDSAILRVIIRPAHCFNNVKDAGESGVDCGGECGGCPGSNCDSNLSNGVCDSNNSLCRWGGCDPTSCLCAVMPSVYYISPARDINGDNVESQLDTYKDDVANGAVGNYITIWGRDFGNTTGTVYFRDRTTSALIEAPLADDCLVPAACSVINKKYWTDTQIIAKVPAGANIVSHTSEADVTAATANYDVYVVTNPGLSSLDNSNPDYANKLFEVNQIDRPGICNICPNHGTYPTSAVISGNKFLTGGTQDIIWYFKAYDPTFKIWLSNNVTSTGSGWSATQVTNSIPQNKNGLTSVRIYNGLQFSNYVKFLISAGNIGDPCGFDFGSCVPSSDVCLAPLTCDVDTCTCQSTVTEECQYHPTSTFDTLLNESRSCTIGGCSGTQYCGRDNKWAPGCAPVAGCVPFLGNTVTRSMFSWAFTTSRYTGPGMSCKSTIWNDDTCDLGGCIDASGRRDNNLSCDINATTGEWLELFNAGSANINLTDWQLTTEQPVSNTGLLYYYSLDMPPSCGAAASTTDCYPQNLAPGNIGGNPALGGIGSWYNYQSGKFGRGIGFNGANTALILLAAEAYNTTQGDFSWSAWYQPAGPPRTAFCPPAVPAEPGFSHGCGLSPAIISRGSGYFISLLYRWDSRFTFTVFGSDKTKEDALSKVHLYATSPTWYHLTAVYNSSQRTIKIYVNGELEGMTVLPSGFSLDRHLNEPLVIGGIYGAPEFDPTYRRNWDIYWANGLINDVKLYTRSLSDSEVAALASKKAFSLSGSLASGNYLKLSTTTIPNFALPQFAGYLSLVDDSGQAVDSISYGPSAITPAYTPGSFGRTKDGLDTGSNSDFGYFTIGTPAAANNPNVTAVGDHLVINEVSLSHEACTCVPKQQLCQPGSSDQETCERIGICAAVRACDDFGHWGDCQPVPGCNPYPLVPGAETAVFTWGILAGFNYSDGPKVVIDCSRKANCDADDTLPSPVPWDTKWNETNYPHLYITKPLACINSVISARFTQSMDASTLTVPGGIRIFRYTNGTNWEDVSSYFSILSLINSTAGAAEGFKIVHTASGDNFVPSTQYKVVLTTNVKDELGRRLVIDDQVSQIMLEEGCSDVVGINGLITADIRFCWNFTTRSLTDPDAECPIGCVDCNPDKYFNRYFGQEKQHEATPISADNVCLQLDGRDYGWSWDEEQQQTASVWANPYPAVPSPSVFPLNNPTYVPWPFSWVTDWAENLIFAGVLGNYSASTTAYRESNWRPYADDSSYFSTDDFDYFRIRAEEVLSEHFDVCRAHNNFTDPIVIENQHCSRGSSLLMQVLQSPSPWKNQQDACRNAVIFALFSRNMYNDSLVDPASCDASGRCSTIYNIEVYDCGDDNNPLSAGRATSSSATTGCTLLQNLPTPITLTARIFNYTHENLTLNDLINAPATVNDSLYPEGIRLYPSKNLDIHRWYKVIIKGTEAGVRGASSTLATGGEKPEGTLRIPSANAQYNDASHPNSYYWYFKTSSEVCPIDQVAVLPQSAFMSQVGETQQYDADPQATNCNHLNPYLYEWRWSSLINPFDADIELCDQQTAASIATICELFAISCPSPGNSINPTVKAFGLSEGHAWIKALAKDTRPVSTTPMTCKDDKAGFGELQIGLGGFRILNHDYTECLNPDISFEFSTDASSISLTTSNIKLYQCAVTDTDCQLATATELPITIEYPLNAGTVSANPFFASRAMFTPSSNLATTTYYRVVVSGGDTGIKSFANSNLEGLNFYTSPIISGEACDPEANPWKGANVCDSGNCKYLITANLCDTLFEECNNNGLRAYYDLNNSRLLDRTGQHSILSTANITTGVNGKSGRAVYFSGGGGIGLNTTNLNPDIGTVSFWINSDKAEASYFAYIFSVNASNASTSLTYGNDNNSFRDKDGNLVARRFVFSYGIGNNSVKLVSPEEYGAGQWQNVVLAWNRAAGFFGLYINGKRVASSTGAFPVVFPTVSSILLGRPTVSNYYFVGSLDELAIYDRLLSDAEIMTLYSTIKPSKIVFGCNSLCHKSGNIHLASCGNSIVEPGEECDDGNDFDGDGCSASCVWEGSNSKYGSLCGNGKIEYGEQCDDGNIANGDGCNNRCLYEINYGAVGAYAGFACGTLNKPTTTITIAGKQVEVKSVCQTPGSSGCNANCLYNGSNPDVPVCGNGKVEDGEQCDSGITKNGIAGDGCGSNCLWKGNANIGTGDGQCGNGKLENGQPDSYSWLFKLNANTQLCVPVSFGVNPCPNGIWWFEASRDVTNLQVRILLPSEINTGGCIKDEDLRKVGFWRRMLNLFVRAVTRFLGIHSAIAVEFWCPVSDQSFSSFELASMAYGNYKRDVVKGTPAVENYNLEILGFTGEGYRYKINYLNKGSWATSTNYKILLNYDRGGIPGTSTAEVLTYDRDCALGGVVFDVWPRGARKTRDSFFCYSNPATGKPDDCGRYSSDLYDDDMSAAWTKDYPGNGYDIDQNGAAPATADYKGGNQHLYRAWATAAKNSNWALRADQFIFTLDNIAGTQTVNNDFDNTVYYQGDQWLTSGSKQGRSLLTAQAFDHNFIAAPRASITTASTVSSSVEIFTLFCNNPWPDSRNFPFEDSANNCTTGSSTCINSNFGTYYCRDAGIDKTCIKGDNDLLGKACSSNSSCYKNPSATGIEGSCQLYMFDDLPAIADFDGINNKLLSGVVKGATGEDCQNLPNNFVPVVGYYYGFSSDTNYGQRTYLWNASGDVYYRAGGAGWQRVNKGDWEKNGLPVNFKPVVGYVFKNEIYLWNSSGAYLKGSYDSVSTRFTWTTASKGNLPANFWPKVGYVYSGNIALWDSQGNYWIFDGTTSSWSESTSKPTNFKPIIGYYGFDKSNYKIELWDSQGNFKYSSNGSSWSDGSKSKNGLPPNFKPNFGYFAHTQNHDILWQGSVVYRSDSSFGNWLRYSLTDATCDNKVKEFLFTKAGALTPENKLVLNADNLDPSLKVSIPPAVIEACQLVVFSDGSVANYWGTNTWSNCLPANTSATTVGQNIIYKANIPSDGKYYIYLETSNSSAIKTSSAVPADATGNYGCYFRNGLVYHALTVTAGGTSASISTIASPPTDHQLNRVPDAFNLTRGENSITIGWSNDCTNIGPINGSATTWGTYDSNLKVYSVKVVPAESVDALDAIGIRVYNNNNHYSPTRWYQTRFAKQGSLTEMSVDDNKAISEGTTVYVDAPDLAVDASGDVTAIYSNIYLMSYSQGARKEVQNIFSQMISNWYFNAGDQLSGGLFYHNALSTCNKDLLTSVDKCLTDADCLAASKGLCRSDKALLTRDVIRLGDLQDINNYLAAYYNLKRCSNDFSRRCSSNSDCYGGGACGNFYPNLRAGSYISGKTYSTWPSWQDSLGKDLGVKLPIDPKNVFYTAITPSGVAEYCDFPYNPVTCWDEKGKSMKCDLNSNSSVYAYVSSESGNRAQVYALGQYGLSGLRYDLWKPAWPLVSGLSYNPFANYYTQIISQQFCQRSIVTCGNGSPNSGEDCSNCPFDKGCTVANQSCQNNPVGNDSPPYNKGWDCRPNKECDGKFRNVGEECDGGVGCTDCKCDPGYDCSGGTPSVRCGDGIVAGSEECDFNAYGVPIATTSVSGIFADMCGNKTFNGQSCCTKNCQKADWFKNSSVSSTQPCGDGLRTDDEQCDCGLGAASINNPFTCPGVNNKVPPASYSSSSRTITDYCDNCQRKSVTNHYCGDHVWDNGREQCDGGNGCQIDCTCNDRAGFQSIGSADCGCKPGYTLNPDTGFCVGVRCGDGLVDATSGEECDSGLGCQPPGSAEGCQCDWRNNFVSTSPLSPNCQCDIANHYKLQDNICVCDTQGGTYFCNDSIIGHISGRCVDLNVVLTAPPAPFTASYCDCQNNKSFKCMYGTTQVSNEICLGCEVSIPTCPDPSGHVADGNCDANCEDKSTDPSCGIRQGDVIGIRVDGDNSGKCDSYDFNYHNPFLSVNSDCSGGDTIVNANRDILGTWEKFMVYFVDNDNNSYLSRGDQFKLVTFNPDVSLGNKVIRAGEDMSATFLKNLRPVNAQGKGEELLLTLCDNNKNCSSGSGSFLNMNNKANTVCFLSTIKDKSDTWYGYLYDDGGQPRHFPLLGEYYKNDLPSAQAEVCNHHFYIDWLP